MKKQKEPQQNGYSPAVNLISEGTEIQGEVQCKGDIRVDGKHSGVIRSQAKVVIGSTGMVDGDVHCQSADIHGRIEGTITAKDILYLKSSARIEGDITTNKLVVESGAMWNGTCSMGNEKKEVKETPRLHEEKPAEPQRKQAVVQ